MAKKIHRSARGIAIDFDLLYSKNSKSIAIGNVPMNARGDRLGKGGKIIQKVEDIDAMMPPPTTTAYNKANPKGIKMISLKKNIDDLATRITDPKRLPKAEDAKTPSAVFEARAAGQKSPTDEDNIQNKRKIVDSQ